MKRSRAQCGAEVVDNGQSAEVSQHNSRLESRSWSDPALELGGDRLTHEAREHRVLVVAQDLANPLEEREIEALVIAGERRSAIDGGDNLIRLPRIADGPIGRQSTHLVDEIEPVFANCHPPPQSTRYALSLRDV